MSTPSATSVHCESVAIAIALRHCTSPELEWVPPSSRQALPGALKPAVGAPLRCAVRIGSAVSQAGSIWSSVLRRRTAPRTRRRCCRQSFGSDIPDGGPTRRWPVRPGNHEPMNPAITSFVEELAADPTTRGVLLFGSQARGTARPDSDADLVIIVDRPGFVMGVAERDGQEFELVHISEATAMAYFSENRDAAADAWPSAKILYDPDGSLARIRDHVAAILARGKPTLDATRAHYLRAAAQDRFRAAAGLATNNDAAARMLLFERMLELVGTFLTFDNFGHRPQSDASTPSPPSAPICMACSFGSFVPTTPPPKGYASRTSPSR